MRVSNAVNEAMRDFYARLATATARHALQSITANENNEDAERWARATEKWLVRAGAQATKYHFSQPR